MNTAASATVSSASPRAFVVAAVAVPVLIVTQFTFLATVPVLVVLISAIRRPLSASVRALAIAQAVAFAAAWATWGLRAHPAASLSKDLSPALEVIILTLAGALLVSVAGSGRTHRRA